MHDVTSKNTERAVRQAATPEYSLRKFRSSVEPIERRLSLARQTLTGSAGGGRFKLLARFGRANALQDPNAADSLEQRGIVDHPLFRQCIKQNADGSAHLR